MCVYLGVTCNLKFFNNAAELFATHKYPSRKKKREQAVAGLAVLARLA